MQTTVATDVSAAAISTASASTVAVAAQADEEPTITATSYSDGDLSIEISTIREYDTDIYVADVQASSVASLKTALARGAYGRNLKETTSAMAEEHGAILALNGDYYGFRDTGYVVRDGVLYRSQAASGTDALVVGTDGSLKSVDQDTVSAQSLVVDGAWQVLSFGPTLVDGGNVVVDANTEVDQAKTSNPRTAIGMISPLHYIIVVSDGRTSQSTGLSLYQLAQVFEEYGCTYAYNLDGGGSSTLWFNGSVVNNPTDGRSGGEREVSDIVYFS